VPALFVIAAAVLLWFTFTANLRNSLWGMAVILAGLPIFAYFRAKRRRQPRRSAAD
jgi:APA family basic amino acid/polyamine antiporter